MNAVKAVKTWVGAAQVGTVMTVTALGCVVLPTIVLPTMATPRTKLEGVPMAVSQEGAKPQNVYLYGEVNRPNQPEKSYFIFSSTGSQIVGAIYYPQSEYTCFIGQKNDQSLSLNLVEPGADASPQLEVSLKPMYAISKVGASEAQALAACRKEVAREAEAPIQTAAAKYSVPLKF